MSKTATANNTLQRYETLKQAAERTGFTERTLRRRIEDGSLIAYRAGRAIRLRPEDVDALFTPTNTWAKGVK